MSFLVNPYWYSPSCGDADAVAFLTATGITDATISSAICTLVISMKANGTWAKCNAIYPFVGGTATTHKFNLKNPLDTNAAFRLSFVGGVTHSSNGITGNAINAWADTFLNQLSLPTNSNHISSYSRTNIIQSSIEIGTMGSATPAATPGIHHSANFTGFGAFFRNNYTGFAAASNANSTGFYLNSRTATNLSNFYKNGLSIATLNGAVTTIYSETFNILGIGYGNYLSSRNLAFASIGIGLNSTEAAALYTSIQAFQTTLSRQV
jgi:hypothetical protein